MNIYLPEIYILLLIDTQEIYILLLIDTQTKTEG